MYYDRVQDARFLVVDDDEDMLSFLTGLFALCGAQSIESAGSGQAALILLAERGPFDLVVTDVCMPMPGGLQLAAMVRTSGCQVPFLVVTAFPDPELRESVARLPRTELVAKPFHPAELLATAERLLRSG
jgi:CheY-like chemotaxis protein